MTDNPSEDNRASLAFTTDALTGYLPTPNARFRLIHATPVEEVRSEIFRLAG